ncbi:hypothetical protein IAR50_001477 [Cryptococcus sp. DSM 104548]
MSSLIPPYPPPADMAPISVRAITGTFIPEPLFYRHGLKSKTSRSPTKSTYKVFSDTKDENVLVFIDNTLIGRLRSCLDTRLPTNVVAPADVVKEMARVIAGSGKRQDPKTRKKVINETQLVKLSEETLWDHATSITTSDVLAAEFRGAWENCTPTNAEPELKFAKLDGTIIAFAEAKLKTVLTEDKVERLVRQASQPDGLRVLFALLGNEGEPVIRVVDRDGNTIDDYQWLADTIAQVWEEATKYPEVNIFLLTTYEIFLPFERDRSAPNILRVGTAIPREATSWGGGQHLLSCLDLILAATLYTPSSPRLPDDPPALKIGTATGGTSSDDPPAGPSNPPPDPWQSQQKATGSRHPQPGDGQKGKGQRENVESGARTLGNHQEEWAQVDPYEPSVWARLDFSGRSSSSGSLMPQHYFGSVGMSNSRIYGWVNKGLASSLLMPRMGGPPPTPSVTPSTKASIAPSTTNLHPIPCLLSPIDDAPAAKLSLAIGSLISGGRLCDVYSVTPRVSISHPADFPSLVVKIMCPSTFDDADGQAEYESGTKAVEAWEKESGFYAEALYGLQGRTVPRCYGAAQGMMYLSDRFNPDDVYVLLLEKLGKAVCDDDEELRTLPHETKLAVVSLYEELHSVRIIHGDVERRHIRRRDDGSLCLIDFEGGRVASAGEKGDRVLAGEMRTVKAMLGLESA